MKFILVNGIIKVKSDSGKSYVIDSIGCSCSGFKWRGKCRHYDLAKKKKMLSALKASPMKPFSSPFIIKMRKDAITQWLKRKRIKATTKLIDKLESVMSISSTETELLAIAKKG